MTRGVAKFLSGVRLQECHAHMGVSIVMEVPPNGCFLLGKIPLKWMMTGGTPIYGNLHMWNIAFWYTWHANEQSCDTQYFAFLFHCFVFFFFNSFHLIDVSFVTGILIDVDLSLVFCQIRIEEHQQTSGKKIGSTPHLFGPCNIKSVYGSDLLL